MKEKTFYTTGDIARMLGVSPTTIFRAIENKQLAAATTPGGHYRVSREDLEAFLKKNNVPFGVPGTASKTVLIVEDSEIEARMFQRALEADPEIRVHCTGSGYGAGFLTKSLRPHVLLLDIFLQDLDGRQVIQMIRGDPELKGTRIIAITGATDPQDIREIKSSGVDGYIQKPVSADELRAKVKELLP